MMKLKLYKHIILFFRKKFIKHTGVTTIILFFFLVNSSFSQHTEVKIDTNSILLGDQIAFHLKITLPKNAVVVFPVFTDTITKDIEVIRQEKIDTIINTDNTITYSSDVIITVFDSGYYVIPPLKFKYSLSDDTTVYESDTEALLLEVKKIQINEDEDIKELKDIFNAPLTFKEILPYILALIVLIFLVFLFLKYFKKIKKNEPIVLIKKPDIPPHIEAINALNALKYKKLWENNFVKEYYSELTEIIRVYIEKGFLVNSMEMTTDETLNAIENTGINNDAKELLKQILELSDLVKFAKYLPIANDHQWCMEKSLEFVNITADAATKKEVIKASENSEQKNKTEEDQVSDNLEEKKEENYENERNKDI